ncbi:Leucine-rich repeat-containing protein 4C [Holothuria leucospilota]|uniref:Leucine-rich repeat-containing protein 4C n=1 Tax=Holothuria leucospilota TaxID=206669 RepID=A0A9Q1BBR9_HOLLE|nr:Leucine-rich repeat-containing protein 4C [Holothuria leucospilota]
MDFAGLTSLRTLILSENRISVIEEGSFRDLLQLNTLQLNSNRLLSLKSTHFIGLGNLTALLIKDNVDLSIDPCIFSYLQSLTSLDIRNTKVDLDASLVTAKVTCTGASLRFPYVEILKSLSIGFKGTSSSASILQEFSSLTVIGLDGFSKASFDNSDISTLSHLISLTLIAVDVYPREFLNSTSLTALTISESTFSCLPKNSFYNLPALKKVVIIRNSLVFIDRQAFSEGGRLNFINLALNQLVYLPKGIFDLLGNSTYFPQTNLNGNSWRCDCNIKWMKTFEPLKGKLILCDTPASVKGMSIFSVNLECNSDSEELTSGELWDEFCPTPSTEDVTQPTKAISSTQPPPKNQSSVLTYVAVGAAVTLISVIILLIIAIVFVNKKIKREPPHPPPIRITTSTSSDNGFSHPAEEEDSDDYSYCEPPTGLPNGLDIAGSREQGLPQRRPNYVNIERPNPVSPPGYVNTRHGRLHSLELKEAMAGVRNGVERNSRNSDRPSYVNSAPRNPPHPRPPR